MVAPPALLWFTGVAPAMTGPSYDPTSVSIDDNPAQPPIVGGSFSDVDVIRFSSGGSDYYYLGFYLPEFSDSNVTAVSRTFRYSVDGLMLSGGAPQFFTNAALIFVPEPSSAVLIGLGLLALVSQRPGKRGG